MGSGTAELLGCVTCHVVPAIIWRREHDDKLFGVLRVQTLDITEQLMAYDRKLEVNEEALVDRLVRRGQTWTPTFLEGEEHLEA